MTVKVPRVAVLTASLPTYFPERHGVFQRCRAELETFFAAEAVACRFEPQVLVTAAETEAALDRLAGWQPDFVLLLHGGFTMGDVCRTLARSSYRLGFWAVPEPTFTGDIQLNGFVSLNMSLSIARIERGGRAPVNWYFGDAASAQFQEPLRTTMQALRAQLAVSGARIGLIGGVAPTFYNFEIDAAILSRAWQATIAELPLATLREAAANVSAADTAVEARAMAAAASVVDVSEAHMGLSARYALAMRRIVEANGFDALAVSDWPELQVDPGFHPGAAFSWVEETSSLPVASEGDVMGAVSQLAARALTGKVGCLLDLCAPDIAKQRMLVWHGGGGPLHLGGRQTARWVNHPMIGRGVPDGPRFGAIADLEFSPGRYTLLRIGASGETLFALEGNIVKGETDGFGGCRGWLEDFTMRGARLTLAELIATVMSHGLEHHFVLIPGAWADAVAELARWRDVSEIGPVVTRAIHNASHVSPRVLP